MMKVVSSRKRLIVCRPKGRDPRARSARTHSTTSSLRLPQRIVCPGPRGLLDHFAKSVPPNRPLERLGHIAAPASRPGEVVDLLHKVLRQQEIRAHVHAHIRAHARAHVKSLRPPIVCGKNSTSRRSYSSGWSTIAWVWPEVGTNQVSGELAAVAAAASRAWP